MGGQLARGDTNTVGTGRSIGRGITKRRTWVWHCVGVEAGGEHLRYQYNERHDLIMLKIANFCCQEMVPRMDPYLYVSVVFYRSQDVHGLSGSFKLPS